MILAAGLGTRLRPLTNDRPKALVEVAGRPLLEIALSRLRSCGVRDVIVNLHHFAGVVAEYLRANQNFGMRIELSYEDALLDTGGGLKKAAPFFLADHRDDPFLLHNVDILSTIDLREMLGFHAAHQALATLAVQDRKTSRYLLFDHRGQLCGRRTEKDQVTETVRAVSAPRALAFSGIHVISPRLLTMLPGDDAFSIITAYLDLGGKNERILAYQNDNAYWCDLGRPESVNQAERDVAQWAAANRGS